MDCERGLLNLTLRNGDCFSIGDDVLVTVTNHKGSIRVHVVAPKNIRVRRHHAKGNKVQESSDQASGRERLKD